MKILIANWVYNWGSTGFIVRDLKNELECLGHQVFVAAGRVYGEDEVMSFSTPSEQSFYWRLHRIGMSPLRGSTKAARRLIGLIESEKPDVVNLHLLHCNFVNLYYLLRWLGKNKIKTVITNHAEIYYTGSCGHAYECMEWKYNECRKCPRPREATGSFIFGNPHRLWREMRHALSFFDSENLSFTAVSPWVRERFKQSPITNRFSCFVTLNGLDTNIFYHRDRQINSSIRGKSVPNKYLLWVSATFNPIDKEDVKGGWYVLELARKMPQYYFVIVATNSLNINDLPVNVILWGKAIDQNELALLYSGASVSILVSRRETFSMVTAESLCCGTPVVGFQAGGPESIAIPDYSLFVPQGNIESLRDSVIEMSSKVFDRKRISDVARALYNRNSMAKQYIEAYKRVLG